MVLIKVQPLIDKADVILSLCQTLLDDAPLNADQRIDIEAILISSKAFKVDIEGKEDTLSNDDALAKKRVRHQLRNHINIIVGFSHLMLKELPDNLLLDMASIRQIYDLGGALQTQVDLIQ